MLETSRAVMTASSSTLQKSAILRFMSSSSEPIGAAEEDVGLDADRAQVADAVLRRLGLELAGRARCTAPASGGCRGVFSRPTSWRNWRIASRNGRLSMSPTVPPISMITTSTSSAAGADAVLDLVGDVRDDLHRASEVVAAPFLLDDRQVDLAGREVVVARGTMLVKRS